MRDKENRAAQLHGATGSGIIAATRRTGRVGSEITVKQTTMSIISQYNKCVTNDAL